jgi:hypothetical protein
MAWVDVWRRVHFFLSERVDVVLHRLRQAEQVLGLLENKGTGLRRRHAALIPQ